jgi:hypothetical protein
MMAFGFCVTTHRARLFRKRASTQCFFYDFVRSTFFRMALPERFCVVPIVSWRFVSDLSDSDFVAFATTGCKPVKTCFVGAKTFYRQRILANPALLAPIFRKVREVRNRPAFSARHYLRF